MWLKRSDSDRLQAKTFFWNPLFFSKSEKNERYLTGLGSNSGSSLEISSSFVIGLIHDSEKHSNIFWIILYKIETIRNWNKHENGILKMNTKISFFS